MANSTNYGWVEPDNSSLVKNGAQDIRALGDAIDTSVWNIGYGQAGKNAIINGNFGIWQRGTGSFAANAYNADRWISISDATVAATQQSFTAGTAPVAGYEGTFFLRTAKSAGGSYVIEEQRVEDVRVFAGQTVTLSFWAKADATVTTAPVLVQYFGSGGSASVDTSLTSAVLTTSWARYSMTVAVPSISGKTIGTGSYLGVRPVRAITASATTIDIWGVQLEYGSKATPFDTATATLATELAACQRYYLKSYNQETAPATASNSVGNFQFQAISATATANRANVRFPVTMRTSPTITVYSTNSGTSAKLYNEAAAVDLDALTQYTGQTGFTVYANSGTPALGHPLLVHYVASAEL